jgi:integrase
MAPFMVALKRRKAGGYAARKVIPKDVREDYAALYGMGWEEKLSIPTGTSPHEAKARHGEWLAEIETRIGALRAAKNGERQSLTRLNAHALAGEWYRWFIARHEADPRPPSYWRKLGDTLVWDVLHPHAPDEFLQDSRADPEWEWKAQPEVRQVVRPLVAQEAKVASFLLEKGLRLNEEAMNLFLDAVEDNLLLAFGRLEALARGDYGPDPLVTQLPEYVPPAHDAPRTVTCGILFEKWQAEVQPARSTVARWTAVFNAADAQFTDASAIAPEAAKEWMIGLISKERSAQTVATVWKTALKTVFTWALGEKLVKSNPFTDVRISVPRRNEERETKAFTPDEAEIILNAALAYKSPKGVDDRARRWVPWICAYTGARAGEITQLRGSDIQKRGDDYFAKLSPSAGKIKTRKARTVPIHEHLVEQGFLAFVEEMGNGPLFYVLPRRPAGKPEPVQSPAERTRARLGDWVRSLGITDPELSPTHAWRHTFKARAERFGMSEKYSDAITGHAPPSAGRRYGKPTPEDLAEALRRFPRYELEAAPNREDLIGNSPEPCKTESL